MTTPIVTPETTLRELGEILRHSRLDFAFAGVSWDLREPEATVVLCAPERAEHTRGHGPDLASAIDDALRKAGVR